MNLVSSMKQVRLNHKYIILKLFKYCNEGDYWLSLVLDIFLCKKRKEKINLVNV
jgi:hypothetical protein